MSKWLARLIVLSTLLGSASFRAQQALTTLEGILSIIWGDPDPQLGSGGKTIYTLVLVDGTAVPLQLTGQEGTAAYYFGKAVIVSGRMTLNQFDITQNTAASMMVVDTIAPGRTAQIQSSIANVVGTKKVIYLLAKFSDDTAVPHPATFYTNLNNPDTPPAGEVFPTTING